MASQKKKIALVPKEIPQSDLFKYFKQLLATYPAQQFMAKCQRDQVDNLLEHLPTGHVVCTETEPRLIKEHVFVISDDPIQDEDSVQHSCKALVGGRREI